QIWVGGFGHENSPMLLRIADCVIELHSKNRSTGKQDYVTHCRTYAVLFLCPGIVRSALVLSSRYCSELKYLFRLKFVDRLSPKKTYPRKPHEITRSADYSSEDGLVRNRLIRARRDFCSSVRFFAL